MKVPTCKKCHKFKKKSVYARHKKTCIPSKKDMEHYLSSKSGNHAKGCNCIRCQKRNKRKSKKKND